MDFYDLRPGITIDDRFEIVSLAGRGGAGVVFRALDRMTGAPVALKVLPPASSDDGVDRMQREARVLAALRHPRIVSYIAHGHLPQERNFLVMEWLEGVDLRQLLQGRQLSLEQSLAILRGVAEGLAAVHRRGIVHRDVKPSNLFVRDGRIDRVMLIDFGVARSQSMGWTLTQTGQVIGTLCYMAPEQVRGERNLGPTVDIFALGCVLYECLTGHPLFGGQHPVDAVARFSAEDPLQFFHSWTGGPGPALIDLLRRMLANDPAARLRDGGALLDALEALGSDTIAEIEQAPVTPALFPSGQEQHLLTFILAVPQRLMKDPDATSSQKRRDPRWPEVEALMKLHRTRLDLLANGIFIVSPTRTRLTPADQAVYMARLGLMLKECLPNWGLAVTTLRGAVAGLQPVGKALWVGADILRAAWHENHRDSLAVIWLDELTARLLDTHFHVRRVQHDTYVLDAERSSPDQQRLLLGRPTPCVGRDNELFLLEAILTSVREDPGARAVLVLAPPGQGKSRLRHEFVRRLKASERPVEVLFGRADPVRAGVPHALLTRAILGLCGLLEPAEGQVGRLEPFVERIGRHVAAEDRQRIVEFLGELCGLHFPDAESPRLRAARQEPHLMSEQLENAWLDFLRAECAVHPVLLVLEDLHWSDVNTVRLVDVALREFEDRPLMVLALARPDVKEVFPQLWEGRNVQELRLGGLPRRACPQLIKETLGERATAEVVERIVRQAGGNALFLEELIRAAAEGKAEELPETVLAMIEARLWRLDPEARRILRVASLFGESFWRRGVMELLGDNDQRGDEFDRWLKILVSEELIVPHGTSRYPNDKEFGFRHALLREAALNIFNEDERVLGHRMAAEYLERQGETDPLVLAEHYERGGVPERAASLYAQAAAQALARSDLEGSLRYVDRGLGCGAQDEALGLLQTTGAWARFWRFDLKEAFRASRAALEVLPAGSAQHYRALGAATLAAWNLGEMVAFDETLRLLGQGDPPSESPESRHAFLEMACMVSSQLAIQGRRQEMATLLAQMESVVAATAEGVEGPDQRDRGQLLIARISWHLYLGGDPWGLYCDAQSGVALFSEIGDRRMQWILAIALGAASLRLGDYEAGAAQLTQAIANLERLQEALGMGLGASHLALGLLELGGEARLAEARLRAEALRDQIGVSYFGGLAHAVLARVLAQEGAWARAQEEIGQALANSHPTAALQPLMLATLTEILLDQGKLKEALDAARQGLARLEQLGGTCWHDIRMHLAAVQAYTQAELHEEARRVLGTAGQLLQQRAERIPDEAVRARYLTRVPYNARVLELLRSLA
ncbi:MAG TPA: protein kinase [Polyangia bacterium]|nr:protein kinase [Polyangia bacterium]